VTKQDAKDFVEPPRTVNKGQEVEDLPDNLVIVNAQKFGSNSTIDWEKLNPARFNLLIVDEAHHYPAPTWNKIVQYFSCKTIFLTATPYRRGVPILERPDTFLCHQSTRDELVMAGVIRKLEFEEVGSNSDSEESRWMVRYTTFLHVLSLLYICFYRLYTKKY
jgi:superfamily II DNA or RNA helicase